MVMTTEPNELDEMFRRGLALRRQVLGAEYVDRSIANANDFMMAFQRVTTEWCWGYAWTRDTLDLKTRSMLNLENCTNIQLLLTPAGAVHADRGSDRGGKGRARRT